MKPYVRGKSIFFREVAMDDSEFITTLRHDPLKSKHLSRSLDDVEQQREFIASYLQSKTDFYFIICDWHWNKLGTVRIYDIRDDSFCWGSWILMSNAPRSSAIESALLIYDFAFFALHYERSHFDVRKANKRVVDFHLRFGANITHEDDCNYYFAYDKDKYMLARHRYLRYLP